MAENETLNSRLRVLIAKSYRAEKLYTSLRSADGAKHSHPEALANISNDARAREWHRCHYELRTALNEILAETSASCLSAAIAALRDKFVYRSTRDQQTMVEGISLIKETCEREEFAHLMRLAVEMVRVKARAQAARAIADELSAIVQGAKDLEYRAQRVSARGIVEEPQIEEENSRSDDPPNEAAPRTNVIFLRRGSNA